MTGSWFIVLDQEENQSRISLVKIHLVCLSLRSVCMSLTVVRCRWGVGEVGREGMEKLKRYLETSEEKESTKLFPKLHLVFICAPPRPRQSRPGFIVPGRLWAPPSGPPAFSPSAATPTPTAGRVSKDRIWVCHFPNLKENPIDFAQLSRLLHL